MRRRVVRTLVLGLPVVGAGAAVAVGFARANWPSQMFWDTRQSHVVVAIVISGLIPVLQTTISELGEKRRRQALEREDNIRALLAGSLVVIARECAAPWDQTGIQAFLVVGWLWRQRQIRVAKIRLSSAPSSGVAWTKGKGVIGVCWETRTRQLEQLDEQPFKDLAKTDREQWLALDRRTTYGLSFDDYQTLGRKYGTVAAVPIMTSDDKYMGCIALDTPSGVRLERTDSAFDSLSITADLVRRLLGR
jgi:hypothetical protein